MPTECLGKLSKVHRDPPPPLSFPSLPVPDLQSTEKIIFIKDLTYPIAIYKSPHQLSTCLPQGSGPRDQTAS